jgi:hypothetical protein
MSALSGQVILVVSSLSERLQSALEMELAPELRALLEMAKRDADAVLECARRATVTKGEP